MMVSIRLGDFHSFRVPVNDAAALDAEIAEQRSSGGAETEHRIFHDRLACSNGVKEVLEVVIVVGRSPPGPRISQTPLEVLLQDAGADTSALFLKNALCIASV